MVITCSLYYTQVKFVPVSSNFYFGWIKLLLLSLPSSAPTTDDGFRDIITTQVIIVRISVLSVGLHIHSFRYWSTGVFTPSNLAPFHSSKVTFRQSGRYHGNKHSCYRPHPSRSGIPLLFGYFTLVTPLVISVTGYYTSDMFETRYLNNTTLTTINLAVNSSSVKVTIIQGII